MNMKKIEFLVIMVIIISQIMKRLKKKLIILEPERMKLRITKLILIAQTMNHII